MQDRHILMVDDNLMFLQSMGNYLKENKLANKLTIAETCEKALQIIPKTKPNIIFQDISFNKSDMDGFACLEQIKKIDSSIKVIMLTISNETILIKKALELNADGYVNKCVTVDELIKAIDVVESGHIYLHDDEVTAQLERDYDKISIKGKKMISNRELEILELISQGYKSSKIGEKLFISHHTVETHRKKLLEKMNAVNSPNLVLKSIELGILQSKSNKL